LIHLRWPLILLLFLAIALSILYINLDNADAKAFLTNGITGIVVAILTTLLIDATLLKREAQRRDRLRRVALRDIFITISHILELFGYIVKVTTPASIPLANDWKSVFSSDAAARAVDLDPLADSPVYPSRPWFQYLAQVSNEIHENLRRELEAYWQVLPEDAVEVLHDLKELDLLSLWRLLPTIAEIKKGVGQPIICMFDEELVAKSFLSIYKAFITINTHAGRLKIQISDGLQVLNDPKCHPKQGSAIRKN
jgi:hypothetical protein